MFGITKHRLPFSHSILPFIEFGTSGGGPETVGQVFGFVVVRHRWYFW
jgi:hypothetical protein